MPIHQLASRVAGLCVGAIHTSTWLPGTGRLRLPMEGGPDIVAVGPFLDARAASRMAAHVKQYASAGGARAEALLCDFHRRALEANLETVRALLAREGGTEARLVADVDHGLGADLQEFRLHQEHQGPVHTLRRGLWDEGLETLAGIVADEQLRAQRLEECHWGDVQGRATIGLDGRVEVAILSFTPMVPEDTDAPSI